MLSGKKQKQISMSGFSNLKKSNLIIKILFWLMASFFGPRYVIYVIINIEKKTPFKSFKKIKLPEIIYRIVIVMLRLDWRTVQIVVMICDEIGKLICQYSNSRDHYHYFHSPTLLSAKSTFFLHLNSEMHFFNQTVLSK